MRTVLVVEDEAPVARLVELTLRTYECAVRVARDADEALEILEHVTPELIVTDVRLPGRSGLELAREVREDERLARTPIVLMSAYGEPRELVGDAFISKPFELDRLLRVLGSYLTVRG